MSSSMRCDPGPADDGAAWDGRGGAGREKSVGKERTARKSDGVLTGAFSREGHQRVPALGRENRVQDRRVVFVGIRRDADEYLHVVLYGGCVSAYVYVHDERKWTPHLGDEPRRPQERDEMPVAQPLCELEPPRRVPVVPAVAHIRCALVVQRPQDTLDALVLEPWPVLNREYGRVENRRRILREAMSHLRVKMKVNDR